MFRALAAFGGVTSESGLLMPGQGVGQGPEVSLLTLAGGCGTLTQHISCEPGLLDHRDFWKEQSRKGRGGKPASGGQGRKSGKGWGGQGEGGTLHDSQGRRWQDLAFLGAVSLVMDGLGDWSSIQLPSGILGGMDAGLTVQL